MNDQIEEEEICRNCVLFEPDANLCNLCSFPVDPDGYVCGEFLGKQEFREEML